MGNVLSLVIMVVSLDGICRLCGQPAAVHPVTVSEVRITPSPDNGAAGMKEDVFFVKFNATLRNTTNHPILVSTEPSILTRVEISTPTGEWKTMLTSSWYDTGDQKYAQCTKVQPDNTFTLPNVNGDIVLRRDRPANRTASVRFYFYNMCMTGSARRSTDFVTEPVQVNH